MAITAPSSRLSLLAAAADAVAVVVFAAAGRLSHGEADDLLGLVATAAPSGSGSSPPGRRPRARGARGVAGRSGGLVCVAGIGLLLRAGFLGRLPLSFAVVATVSLTVLLLGWRGLAALVSRTAHRAVP